MATYVLVRDWHGMKMGEEVAEIETDLDPVCLADLLRRGFAKPKEMAEAAIEEAEKRSPDTPGPANKARQVDVNAEAWQEVPVSQLEAFNSELTASEVRVLTENGLMTAGDVAAFGEKNGNVYTSLKGVGAAGSSRIAEAIEMAQLSYEDDEEG